VDDFLNWLVQGSLVAVATAVVLRVMATHRARVRYQVVSLALMLVAALPLIPLMLSSAGPAAETTIIDAPGAGVVALPTAWWTSGQLVTAAWAIWACVALGRVGWATIALRGLRRNCRRFPADVEAALASWTSVRAGGRHSRLMLSDEVASAAVLGYFRPVIAVAPAVVANLSNDDLDRIVIHEWAHVRRRDDLAQALQAALQIAAGWHPAVWWLDRRLRLEREMACDETVVDMTGSAKTYAACLTRLAGLRLQQRSPVPSLAAVSASNLRPRIMRLLAPRRASRRGVSAGAQVMLCSLAVCLGGFRFIGVDAVKVGQRVVEVAVPPATHPVQAAATAPASRVKTIARQASQRMPPARSAQRAPDAAPVSNESTAAAPVRAESPVASAAASPAPLPATAHPPAVGAVLPSGPPQSDERARTTRPWTTAADAGVAVGQTSQKAAVATAGFFTRFGKKVAASF
jgi:beta-lactamase regulating signal transducer with metallopeptidase domain